MHSSAESACADVTLSISANNVASWHGDSQSRSPRRSPMRRHAIAARSRCKLVARPVILDHGIGVMAGSFGIGLGCWVMVRVSSRVRVG